MTYAVGGTILAIVLFAVAAPRLGRRMPQAMATRLLVPASVVLAASSVCVLGTLAATWIGQLPPIAALAAWSPSRLDASDPVPDPIAALSAGLLLVVAIRVAYRVVRVVRSVVAVHRAYPSPSSGPVIVVDSPRREAFATPAPAGRVVVTSGLLRVLNPTERRVVLAHERSHVTHRHIWWTLIADIAATVNPLLRPTATVVDQAVERWADEDAADVVGDRQAVARTIARVALLDHEARRPAAAATGGDVPQRVRALLAPPPRRHRLATAVLAALLVTGAVATVAVEQSGDRLFDSASAHVVHTHHHHGTATR